MTYSNDFRWRCVVLHYMYGIPVHIISDLLGPKPRTILRWNQQFNETGCVEAKKN